MGQAVQMLESWSVGMCWVWRVLEMHRSASSSIDTRWNLGDWDIVQLLESDRDAHLSEDIWVQTGSDTGDTTDTCITLTIQTVDILYLLPTSLRGIPAGYNEVTRHQYCLPLNVFMFFCFEVIRLLVVGTHFIASTRTLRMKDGPHCLMGLFRKHVCFWRLLCRWAMIGGTRWKIMTLEQCCMALYGYAMNHIYSNILLYTEISIF
jgi:hypothetical protein